MVNNIKVIGVMGSGEKAWDELSTPLGQWIARQGYHLLTGGGRGVMEAVARAFTSVSPRPGLSIGIIPGRCEGGLYSPLEGYPNPYIELPVHTHLPDSGAKGDGPTSRNPINILTSDLIIALPGGAGTQSEIALARRHGKPLALLGPHPSPVLPVLEHTGELFSWVEDILGRPAPDDAGLFF